MKKRFVTTLIALIACVACALGLVACGEDSSEEGSGEIMSVAGKTFVCSDVSIDDYDNIMTEQEKIENEAGVREEYIGMKYSFDDSGNTKLNDHPYFTYTQNGEQIVFEGEDSEGVEYKVSGNNFLMIIDAGFFINLIFTQV